MFDHSVIELIVCFVIVCLVTAVLILRLNIPIIIKFRQSTDISLSYWTWGIILSGIATHWITALAVWIILQIKGLPVLSLSDIFSGAFIIAFFILTIILAIPFILFSIIARKFLRQHKHIDAIIGLFEKKTIILNGTIGGIITITFLAQDMYRYIDETIEWMVLMSPVVVLFGLFGILIALIDACIAIIAGRILWNVQEVGNIKGQK